MPLDCLKTCSELCAEWAVQLDVMRVLSVPQPASGTVDLVKGHPALTGRQLYCAHYAGKDVVRLDNVELRGHDVYVASHKKKSNGRTVTYQFPEQEFDATWYAQVSGIVHCQHSSV